MHFSHKSHTKCSQLPRQVSNLSSISSVHKSVSMFANMISLVVLDKGRAEHIAIIALTQGQQSYHLLEKKVGSGPMCHAMRLAPS